MEDEEGIGLILARATELRLKISDCIDTSSTAVSDGVHSGGRKDGSSPAKKDEFIGNQEKDSDEEEAERLLCIRDALESLESQLAALQNLRQRQQYEKQVALSEIDYSRKIVDYENDLLLPPYHVHPHLPSKHKKSDVNGFGSGHVRKVNPNGGSGVIIGFLGSVAKIMLPLIGVISILKRGASLKLLQQQVVRAPNQCPRGKVLVFGDGEARCLVKERVEIPFDSVVAKRDVTYGYG
ncbi:hypothetical protein HID58_085148 [Brassica napus]|uniref:BnaC09g08840D protein n=3 Tax=Brassica TaxID=3705 RepID=A0A078GNI7_BRANA|nr:hypothetical protein HID58_085148 [Brassica napus]CAF1717479.1 unnamed protein product [Brassica napus]CDY26757.1 BnaC09g08840D [Brassica napus]VDD28852.1 unnamed protein product [Brassica oleracea]